MLPKRSWKSSDEKAAQVFYRAQEMLVNRYLSGVSWIVSKLKNLFGNLDLSSTFNLFYQSKNGHALLNIVKLEEC